MRRKWLPDNVTEYKDRHGKPRYRFRKRGLPEYHFKHAPGTPEFMEELRAAQTAPKVEDSRWLPFTYDALAISYYETPNWIKSKASTQATYRGIIERWRSSNGRADVRRVTTANIDKKLASMAETPAAANNLRKVLSRLHRHAIKLGWRQDNPVAATDAYEAGEGHHCWTDDELDAFDKRWPIGTKERLAKELLFNTALRKSDVLTVGSKNVVGNRLELYHSKNDSATSIPIAPNLRKALDACPSDPFISTIYGKPYTSTGFYNWFKRACEKAGIGHCSPHGLRKAISRQLAESGATVLEGRAVTGHKTDKEFMRYAEAANRRLMADRALANLVGDPAEQNTKTEKNASNCNSKEKSGGGQG